ncbi:MAG: sulfurtransferase [Flavobacteriaceae bacterium]
MSSPLVSSDWLQKNLSDPNLIILDASQQDNKAGLVASSGNLQIVGARVFDIKNTFSCSNSPFPNTLLKLEEFQEKCRELGIHTSSKIVVYDNLGIYTSPRVWWMFKLMGFEDISVLDGGLPDWIAQGYPTQKPVQTLFKRGDFNAVFDSSKVRDFNFLTENLILKTALVIDARSANRFKGITPEPRKGLRGGHIPNSINIPYTEVLDHGKFKTPKQLIELFKRFEIKNHPLIFSCGSGITACILLLAAELALQNTKALYDGSWTEWAQLT